MPTGNEVLFYRHIEESAKALTQIAEELSDLNAAIKDLHRDLETNTANIEQSIERVVTAVEKYGN